MKNTISLLNAGFESSSGTTQEFLNFVKTFKREFTKELKSINATDIKIGKGHFYVSGFFTINGQKYYFSLSDVRDMNHTLLYRTAQNYKDYTGGSNQWINLKTGIAKEMNL